MAYHKTTTFATGVYKHESSRAWATKHLHPPGPIPDGYSGYPDNNNSGSVHSEFRLTKNVTKGITRTDSAKDMLFLVAPGFTSLVFQSPPNPEGDTSTTNFWCADNESNYGQTNTSVDLRETQDISSARMAYRSTTFYLNTNALTNKGTVTVGGFRPDYTTYDQTQVLLMKERYGKHKGWAEMEKALNSLNVAGKVREDYYNERGQAVPTPFSISGFTVQVVKLGHTITSEQDVLQLSPKSTQTPATEGAFVRQFISQPTNNYKGGNSRASSTPQLNFCAYETIANDIPSIYFFMNKSTAKPGDISYAIEDLSWFDYRWYYVYFGAVDPVSSITVKTIVGYEVQPLVGTFMSTQIHPPALPDNLCLESVSEIVCVAPDSLPSIYNDEGPAETATATLEAAGEEGKEVDASNQIEIAARNNAVRATTGTKTPKTRERKSKGRRHARPSLKQNKAQDGPTHPRPPTKPNHAKGGRRGATGGKQRGKNHKRPTAANLKEVRNEATTADHLIKRMRKLLN